jgi:hypothetical protein
VAGIIGPDPILDRKGYDAGEEPRGAGGCSSPSIYDRPTVGSGSLVCGGLGLGYVTDEPCYIGAAKIPYSLLPQQWNNMTLDPAAVGCQSARLFRLTPFAEYKALLRGL